MRAVLARGAAWPRGRRRSARAPKVSGCAMWRERTVLRPDSPAVRAVRADLADRRGARALPLRSDGPMAGRGGVGFARGPLQLENRNCPGLGRCAHMWPPWLARRAWRRPRGAPEAAAARAFLNERCDAAREGHECASQVPERSFLAFFVLVAAASASRPKDAEGMVADEEWPSPSASAATSSAFGAQAPASVRCRPWEGVVRCLRFRPSCLGEHADHRDYMLHIRHGSPRHRRCHPRTSDTGSRPT